mmetsp:Transcript_19786/g.61454  ORF Transcript_19786/g.61454 Transcript_19786/m.61454 type:complete len:246 (-) Transcript_19786:25-762(-)
MRRLQFNVFNREELARIELVAPHVVLLHLRAKHEITVAGIGEELVHQGEHGGVQQTVPLHVADVAYEVTAHPADDGFRLLVHDERCPRPRERRRPVAIVLSSQRPRRKGVALGDRRVRREQSRRKPVRALVEGRLHRPAAPRLGLFVVCDLFFLLVFERVELLVLVERAVVAAFAKRLRGLPVGQTRDLATSATQRRPSAPALHLKHLGILLRVEKVGWTEEHVCSSGESHVEPKGMSAVFLAAP